MAIWITSRSRFEPPSFAPRPDSGLDSSGQKYPRARVEFAHLLRGIAAASVLLHHFLYMFWNKPEIVANLIIQPNLPRLIGSSPPFSLKDFGITDFWGHF